MTFGTDVGNVRRTRSFVGENTAGMTGVDDRKASDEVERPDREPEPPIRLGSAHTWTRKDKRDVFSG